MVLYFSKLGKPPFGNAPDYAGPHPPLGAGFSSLWRKEQVWIRSYDRKAWHG
jgi:hypothetical protein